MRRSCNILCKRAFSSFSLLTYTCIISGAAEHMFADNLITVREDEPTSIIAFTLKYVWVPLTLTFLNSARSSKDHRQAISKSQAERRTKSIEHSETFMPDDSSDGRSTWGLINSEDAPDPSELMKQPTNVTHLSFRRAILISECSLF